MNPIRENCPCGARAEEHCSDVDVFVRDEAFHHQGDTMDKIPVAKEHLDWLMTQVENRCTDKERANVGRIHGRFDLEIVIVVAPQDKLAITDEFLVDMKRALRERTGLLSPVIYLDGYEPPIVRNYDPYY